MSAARLGQGLMSASAERSWNGASSSGSPRLSPEMFCPCPRGNILRVRLRSSTTIVHPVEISRQAARKRPIATTRLADVPAEARMGTGRGVRGRLQAGTVGSVSRPLRRLGKRPGVVAGLENHRPALKALAQKVGGIDYVSVGSANQRFLLRCTNDPSLADLSARALRQLKIAEM